MDEIDHAGRVSAAVTHFLTHWEATQKAFATRLADYLKRVENAQGISIPGGRSEKALSAWKNGTQLPDSHHVLIAMRKITNCRCVDVNGGFRMYADEKLRDMLEDARASKATSTESDVSADAASLERVMAVSAATVQDCDMVVDPANGLRLRLSNVYVERELEHRIVHTLRPRSLTAVRGDAGYGKTALMWRLHQRLAEEGKLALLIPATALLRGARGERDSGALTVDDLWAALRAAVREHRSPVLLVDTIDLLTHSPETAVEVRRLMRSAVQCRVPMVVACRPAEAALLHLDDEDDNPYGVQIRPLQLKAFNDRERREAIESYARSCYSQDSDDVIAVVQDAQLRGRPLREVVANPLTLRMLFELYAGDGERPDPDIDGIGLYTLMWHRRVTMDQRDRATPRLGPDLSAETERTALAMLAHGRIELRRSELAGWLGESRPVQDSVALLVARAVLKLREETQRLWFWHQTWFEYTAARAVARRGHGPATALADFVAEEPYDLLFGEVMSQLILLARRTPEVSIQLAEQLLTGWLQNDEPGLRILALRTYARFRGPSKQLQAAAALALEAADDRTGKDFLRLLPSVNHPDAERWQADLAMAWKREGLRMSVIEALTRLAAGEPAAATAFAVDHECVDWLVERPVRQWRTHESPHLRLFAAIARHDRSWAADQAMKFWAQSAQAGITAGLADIIRFLIQHECVEQAHYQTVSETLRILRTADGISDLQRAYADMVVHVGDVPTDPVSGLNDILADTDAAEVWRRAKLRAIARGAFPLTPATVTAFLERLFAARRDDKGQDYRATLLAELLSGPRGTAILPPVTQHVRLMCRTVLSTPNEQDGQLRLFVTAVRYARLDGATLSQILPENITNPEAWFSAAGLGPLLVEAAAVGNQAAERALRWSTTDQGRARVPAKALRDIGTLMQGRAENAPRLLTHIVSIAAVNLDTAALFASLERLPADVTTAQPGVVEMIAQTCRHLVHDREPHRRSKGYGLWRALVRNDLHPPPTPNDLAETLAGTGDVRLINAVIGVGIEAIERESWLQQDVSRLTAVLERYVSVGQQLRRGPVPKRQATNHEALARQLLVGLLSRTAPLAGEPDQRREHVRRTASYVFEAGYDVARQADLHAFTPCVTTLGWLVDRLVEVSPREAMDALLDFTTRLHTLHPKPVHWRQTLAVKWQYTVVALTNTLVAAERQALVEALRRVDRYLVAHAISACVTRDQAVPPWILQIIDHLPGTVRGQLRSSLFENARERSHRRWDAVQQWIDEP